MRRAALCLGLLLIAGVARADDPLAALMARLATVKASTAHFTETKTLSVLSQPVVSSGTLAWRAPDHLERITAEPRPDSLVVDGDTLTLTQNGAARTLSLSDVPGIGPLVEAIRGTLAGNLALLESHYAITLQGDAAHWVLLLQPSEPEVRRLIQYIRISGAGAVLTRVETLQANGDSADMTIAPGTP